MEYQLGDNPNVKGFVTYQVSVNDNEKIVLEVGAEGVRNSRKLPKGVKPKNCKRVQFNQNWVNKINNKSLKVFVVRKIGKNYNISPVSMATYYRMSGNEVTFVGNNYDFFYKQDKNTTGEDLSSETSGAEVYYQGREPYSCSEAIEFRKIPQIGCCCYYTDIVLVPKVGIIEERMGVTSEKAPDNVLRLRSVNGTPFNQFISYACEDRKPQVVEEVVVARQPEPTVYDVIVPQKESPPPPKVDYGLIVNQSQVTPPVQEVAYVPYELMIARSVAPETYPNCSGIRRYCRKNRTTNSFSTRSL